MSDELEYGYILVSVKTAGGALPVANAVVTVKDANDNILYVEFTDSSGNTQVMLTERGTSFGYNTLVVDMTGLVEMRSYGYPVIFDATHAVQKPGANGTSSGGCREYVPYLMNAALAVGVDGIFAEVHPCPEKAISDAANQIALKDIRPILEHAIEIDKITKRY